MSLFPQDPAEAFLLAQTQTLIPPPSWKAQAQAQGPTPGDPSSSFLLKRPFDFGVGDEAGSGHLLPTTLGSKDRKLSKTMRVVERPRMASSSSEYPPVQSIPSRPRPRSDSRPQSQSQSTRHSSSSPPNQNPRIPSPEEHSHWLASKRESNRLSLHSTRPQVQTGRWDRADAVQVEGGGGPGPSHGPEEVVVEDEEEDEEDEEEGDLCVICLMKVDDRTVVGDCGHSIFCFECINVWSNQSRKCPLCTAPMRAYLLHMLDKRTGPVKFFLPPKPTINPNIPTTTFASTLPTRLPVPRFRQRGPDVLIPERDIYARTRSRHVEGEDGQGVELERQVERRREVYGKRMFAKHLGSNAHTRYKPLPTPKQFAENPEYTTRATMWLRRELRVWRDLDVEFLTTYIISLMRSIDIRSEPAVRLLSDFLDVRGSEGRERKGTEHFLHEFVAFLRSPYRDLAIYDAVVQYEQPPPLEESDEDEDDFFARRLRAGPSRAREPSIAVEQREELAIEAALDEAEEVMRERSMSRSPRRRSISTSSSSCSGRGPIRSDRMPVDRGRRPSPASPKRWDKADSWVAPPSDLDKKWNESDSWVDEELLKEVMEEQRQRQEKEGDGTEVGGLSSLETGRPSENTKSKDLLAEPSSDGPEPDVAHRGMRGWGEPGDRTESMVEDVGTVPVEVVDSASQRQPLSLRIFGTATNPRPMSVDRVEARSATPPEGVLEDLSSDDEEAMLDAHVWGTEDAIDLSAIIEKRKTRRASKLSDRPATPAVQRQEAAVAQAREAIINNANKRAERKEQLLAKLVRAKMQARQKRNVETRVEIQRDEVQPTSYSQPTDVVSPVPISPDANTFEASNGTLAAAALEAEAKAKAKAKLHIRLMQARKRQAALTGSVLQPVEREQQPALVDGSSVQPPSAQDRAALLREKLLKARAVKQSATSSST